MSEASTQPIFTIVARNSPLMTSEVKGLNLTLGGTKIMVQIARSTMTKKMNQTVMKKQEKMLLSKMKTDLTKMKNIMRKPILGGHLG